MLIYWNTSKFILKEGVRTDEKVALQIQRSQFMLKYSNQCFFYIPSSEQKSEGKKHNIENNSNELYLSRWNVKNIDLNIFA